MENNEEDFVAWVSVASLCEHSDPLSAWVELETSISADEVWSCVDRGEEGLVQIPREGVYVGELSDSEILAVREAHIKKIAYFVVNEPTKPIDIDVGVPSLGCHVMRMVGDGNHRLAGSMIKGRATIQATISGDISYAEELGLIVNNEKRTELALKAEYK